MHFDFALKSFLDHLRIERGLAENSISAYQRDLTRFGNFLQGRDFAHLEEADVIAFEISLQESEHARASINRALSSLRSFYGYSNKELGAVDPTGEIERKALARKLPKALTIAEITAMIESAKREGDPLSLRDFAILELLYSSGGRVSEIVGIDLGDISHDADVTLLKLKGKGSKERLVPLGRYAQSAIDEYLVRTRPHLAKQGPHSALFLNNRGARLSRQSAWQIVRDAAEATGLQGKISPHVFRHSYATHLLDGGADIRVVQELLGHASVTTTQIYTLVTIDKVREAYATAHPRAH